jgi:hypothetical protein
MADSEKRFSFAVMLQVTTTDPRLSQEAIVTMLNAGQASGFAAMRRAVLQHVPKDVSRVIALFPLEHAKMLMMLHEAAGEDITKFCREQGWIAEDDGTLFVRPPADYVPPTAG